LKACPLSSLRQRHGCLGNVQQVARAAGRAVKPGHGHHVTGAQVIEQPGQLRPPARGAGVFFSKCGSFLTAWVLVE